MTKKKVKEFDYRDQFPITDTHDMSYRGTPKKIRTLLDIGDIYVNAVICGLCNYFIRSRNRHDMVTCKCGNVSVDGGSWYAKRNFKTMDFVDVIELYKDVKKPKKQPN